MMNVINVNFLYDKEENNNNEEEIYFYEKLIDVLYGPNNSFINENNKNDFE